MNGRELLLEKIKMHPERVQNWKTAKELLKHNAAKISLVRGFGVGNLSIYLHYRNSDSDPFWRVDWPDLPD